jgi:hypothetical protein
MLRAGRPETKGDALLSTHHSSQHHTVLNTGSIYSTVLYCILARQHYIHYYLICTTVPRQTKFTKMYYYYDTQKQHITTLTTSFFSFYLLIS